ncbi:DMT family transporter [Vibrio alginolyticus]
MLSVQSATVLLIFGNLVGVLSDALIKTLTLDVSIFQFVLYRQVTAILILFPFLLWQLKNNNNQHNVSNGLMWHFIRSHVWLLGAIFMVISLNSMPIATANAIFYSAPLLMLPMAFFLYRERLSQRSIASGVLGFIGVLIIIRPNQIDWGSLSALAVALTLAANNLLIRKIPKNHTVIQTLFFTNLLGIPASLLLALWEGGNWSWKVFITAAGSSAFILIYAGICVVAYRDVESNKIASAEYTGLLGAAFVGIVFFEEVPDLFMLLGALFIIVSVMIITRIRNH